MIISRESSILEAKITLVMLVNKKDKDKLVYTISEKDKHWSTLYCIL